MILVIAGTSDAVNIVKKLKDEFEIIASVTTEYGKKILVEENANVIVKKMDKEDMLDFIDNKNINLIIDASHPYAKDVSKNAIEVSKLANIDYIRYERTKDITLNKENFYSYDDAIEKLENTVGNILLTIGSNNLYKFMTDKLKSRIYARILPTSSVILKCEKLGLTPDRIIAMKGPFSKEMNKIMIEELDIKYLVTKESSSAGGFLEKVKAVEEKNIEILVIERPKVKYPLEFDSIDKLIEYVFKEKRF